MEFVKNKFDLLLVSAAFCIIFGLWIYFNFEVKLEPYVFAIFGSWLTVLGLRPRPNQTDIVTGTVKAEHLDSAKTEQGDIVVKEDGTATRLYKGEQENV